MVLELETYSATIPGLAILGAVNDFTVWLGKKSQTINEVVVAEGFKILMSPRPLMYVRNEINRYEAHSLT